MTSPNWRRLARKRALRTLPRPALDWARARRLQLFPRVGRVRFGHLRTVEPISRTFGYDRGTPVDRHYIEAFLRARGGSEGDVRGRVLEVKDDAYARRFGAPGQVESVDVLDVDETNVNATLLLDLGVRHDLDARYDCIICTQTLLLVYDVHAAIANLHRLLAPGGVLLLTVPGMSSICRSETGHFTDYWRFTSASVRRLLTEAFDDAAVTVETHGNVLASAAFLYGLCAADLRTDELDHSDPDFQLVIAARAVKSA